MNDTFKVGDRVTFANSVSQREFLDKAVNHSVKGKGTTFTISHIDCVGDWKFEETGSLWIVESERPLFKRVTSESTKGTYLVLAAEPYNVIDKTFVGRTSLVLEDIMLSSIPNKISVANMLNASLEVITSNHKWFANNKPCDFKYVYVVENGLVYQCLNYTKQSKSFKALEAKMYYMIKTGEHKGHIVKLLMNSPSTSEYLVRIISKDNVRLRIPSSTELHKLNS